MSDTRDEAACARSAFDQLSRDVAGTVSLLFTMADAMRTKPEDEVAGEQYGWADGLEFIARNLIEAQGSMSSLARLSRQDGEPGA